jgi:hypothetical protein
MTLTKEVIPWSVLRNRALIMDDNAKDKREKTIIVLSSVIPELVLKRRNLYR